MAEKSQAQFDAEVREAKAKLADARARLLGIPGVVAVEVGLKETRGMATQEVGFQVYVDRKKPLAEVAEAERIPPVVAGIGTDVIVRGIDVAEDVICGGFPVTQALWGASYGTLGAIGLATAANTHVAAGTPLFLTNQHVAKSIGKVVGQNCLCDSWCCECCDIGRLVDAGLTDRVDGAIGTLNPGVRFSHDILGIGAIRGTTVATIGMVVVKYGQKTDFTRGRVSNDDQPVSRSDGHDFVHQIRVAPEPPFQRMSDHGDSGSVYLEEATRRIVGLHHTGAGDGETTSKGSHIADVMDLLKIEFPVTGTAGAIPLSGIEEAPRLEAVTALQRELEGTPLGREWANLIRVHSTEVRHLVNHHRAAKVAWQRCQGPAFLAHFLKSARDASHHVPREIAGTRLENSIVSMAAVLRQHGSRELAAAVEAQYLTALELSSGAGSASDVFQNVRRVAGGVGLGETLHA